MFLNLVTALCYGATNDRHDRFAYSGRNRSPARKHLFQTVIDGSLFGIVHLCARRL